MADPSKVAQGKPGQNREYTAFGQTFTQQNPETPLWKDVLGTYISGGLMRALTALGQKSSAPARMYREAVIDRRTTPFTEKDFTTEQLQQLSKVARQGMSQGRMSIQTEDYKGDQGGNWNSMVGRANLQRDANNNIHVLDSYDFNNYEMTQAGKDSPYAGGLIEAITKPHVYYGRRALPSGIRGTPVNITLPAGPGRGMAPTSKRK